mgnify:CR=1 FL=1
MLMDGSCQNAASLKVHELNMRISSLEDQFVELFVNEGCREALRKMHLQITVLKKELQISKPSL